MLSKENIKKGLTRWIETVVISLLFIIASNIVHDPLSLKSPFPWIWFAPVLIALRYGLWPSQCSFLLLILSYLHKNPTAITTIHFQLFILGGFLLTLVCVMFQSSWSKRVNHSHKVSTYLQKRIQSIAYSYKIVSLAYQRIEQNYVIKPVSIRSSLAELRELLARSDNDQKNNILNRFLNVAALQCSLEVAAIFPVKNNRLIPKSIASIGKITLPKARDFLIEKCLETKAITYIKAKEMLNKKASNHLIIAPFINQRNQIYALLIVEEMPFLSLTNDNIETLGLLIQYFIEGNTVKNADLILKQYPDCPVMFANELQRLTNLQIQTQQDSAVVAFILLEHPHQKDYLFRLQQERRGIDSSWEITQETRKILILLMPLTYRAGIEGYRIRINNTLENEFGTTLNKDTIKFKSCQISSINNPVHLLQDLLNIT